MGRSTRMKETIAKRRINMEERREKQRRDRWWLPVNPWFVYDKSGLFWFESTGLVNLQRERERYAGVTS